MMRALRLVYRQQEDRTRRHRQLNVAVMQKLLMCNASVRTSILTWFVFLGLTLPRLRKYRLCVVSKDQATVDISIR
jgi:hypothetical protein